MRDDDDRRNGRKLSWKELDQLREKGGRRDRDAAPAKSSPTAVMAQKSYRAALERAFASGKLDELAKAISGGTEPAGPAVTPPPAAAPANGPGEPYARAQTPLPLLSGPTPKDPEREARAKLLARIKESEDKPTISRAVDAYLAKAPRLPDDFEVLTKALGHKDEARVHEVLAQVMALIARDKPRRARALAGQLRLIEETSTDPELRRLAADVRGRL